MGEILIAQDQDEFCIKSRSMLEPKKEGLARTSRVHYDGNQDGLIIRIPAGRGHILVQPKLRSGILSYSMAWPPRVQKNQLYTDFRILLAIHDDGIPKGGMRFLLMRSLTHNISQP